MPSGMPDPSDSLCRLCSASAFENSDWLLWVAKAEIRDTFMSVNNRPRLCKNAEVVSIEKLPILRKEISSRWQHEAIHRRRGPSPGDLAAGVPGRLCGSGQSGARG